MSGIPLGRRSGIGTPPDLINYPLLTNAVVHFLFEGWKVAITSATPPSIDEEEERMNGALAQGIRATVEALSLGNIEVVETPGERSDPTLRLPDTEPDVILILAHFDGGVMTLRAIIECKRLDPLQVPNRTLRRDYVTRGMDRFITERYGRGRQLCFMAAYVLWHDGAAAMADVNAYLMNVGRTADCLATSTRYSQRGFMGESSHARPDGRPPLLLLHAFLPFAPTSADPSTSSD
jgi:hypothetical protein